MHNIEQMERSVYDRNQIANLCEQLQARNGELVKQSDSLQAKVDAAVVQIARKTKSCREIARQVLLTLKRRNWAHPTVPPRFSTSRE